MELKIGDKIKLQGTSLKGKNRVHEHGDIWLITKGPAILERGFIRRGQICIEPVDKKGFLSSLESRWIMPVNDKDFEILDKVA